jgi:cytochrome c biogenesis protein CcmG, thiol:disulfide interchange protein DsbE
MIASARSTDDRSPPVAFVPARALCALVLLCAAACVRAPASTPVDEPAPPVVSHPGQPVDFTVRRLPSGSAWSPSADRGSVVLLDVWATWCDPCRATLPLYQDVARQFAGRGLKVYALSVDAEARDIGPFLQALGVDLPVLHDPAARVAESVLQVKQMPTSLLLDRRGVVRFVHEGLSDDVLEVTVRDVEVLLSEGPP